MNCQCEHISHRHAQLGGHEYGKADVVGIYGTKTAYGNFALCDACKNAGHMGSARSMPWGQGPHLIDENHPSMRRPDR